MPTKEGGACAVCGAGLPLNASNLREYCSGACSQEAHRLREGRAPRYAYREETHSCVVCGGGYTPGSKGPVAEHCGTARCAKAFFRARKKSEGRHP